MPDDEVVRDQQVGEVERALEMGQQVEDLRLDRDVEGGDRLVGDDQHGPERERARDPDPLALAARELVGIPVVVLRARGPPISSSSSTRAFRSAVVAELWTTSAGRRRSCRPVCRGFRLAYGSWNTICISRRERAAAGRVP